MSYLFDDHSRDFSMDDLLTNKKKAQTEVFSGKQLGTLWTQHIISRQNSFLLEYGDNPQAQGAWALALAACNFNNEQTAPLLKQAVALGAQADDVIRLVLQTQSTVGISALKEIGVDVFHDQMRKDIGYMGRHSDPAEPLEILLESYCYPDRAGRYQRTLDQSPIWEVALNLRSTPCLMAMIDQSEFSPDQRLPSRTLNLRDRQSSLLASAIGYGNMEVALAILEKTNPNQDTLDEAILACAQVHNELYDIKDNLKLYQKVIALLGEKGANPTRPWELRADGLLASQLYDRSTIQQQQYDRYYQEKEGSPLAVSAQQWIILKVGEDKPLTSKEAKIFLKDLSFNSDQEKTMKNALLNVKIYFEDNVDPSKSRTGYAAFIKAYPWKLEEWKESLLQLVGENMNSNKWCIWDRLVYTSSNVLDHATTTEIAQQFLQVDRHDTVSYLEDFWQNSSRQEVFFAHLPNDLKALWKNTLGACFENYQKLPRNARKDEEEKAQLQITSTLEQFKNGYVTQPRRSGPRL